MPASRRIRIGQPSRPSRPHSGQSLDPTLTRKGAVGHPGSIIMAICGFAFFAYAFNLGGLQHYLDGVFGALDASVHSHNGDVARVVIMVFPYVGVAAGALLLFFLLSMIAQAFQGFAKPSRPKHAQESNQPAPVAAAPEMIKPMRLAVRELDMKPAATRLPNSEAPAAELSAE